mgnify:CR=1 FL=1
MSQVNKSVMISQVEGLIGEPMVQFNPDDHLTQVKDKRELQMETELF